jgi:hypothetical protein
MLLVLATDDLVPFLEATGVWVACMTIGSGVAAGIALMNARSGAEVEMEAARGLGVGAIIGVFLTIGALIDIAVR